MPALGNSPTRVKRQTLKMASPSNGLSWPRAMTSNVRGSSAPATPKPRPSPQPATSTRKHHNCTSMQTSHMRVLITNAFGLCSKFAEFQHTLCKSKADIAIVIETKFTSEKMSVAETSIAGYHPPLRQDRTAQGRSSSLGERRTFIPAL